ncbi:polysaccharide biosynthesis tyrosine autokinase [Agrococcus beijingensis]|uniref:polysaccharide biosynthesis tyrosine autokinase n=1 Tax=Agrococcus beijingensis TaxID=3068634 RepID=UPI00274124D0|nr:polysaccharide biosynthesis tyrosine autokinase [Agrococcus sp. REN33]
MGFLEYVRLLRKHWAIVVVAAILGVAAGLGLAAVQTPEYRASTEVFISTQAADTSSDLVQGNAFTLSRVNTYARLASSEEVLERVVDELELDLAARDLIEQVEAAPVANTAILEIAATSDQAQFAADLANATAAALAEAVSDLESDGASSPVRLATIVSASVPAEPESPRPLLQALLGGLLMIVAALAFIVARDLIDTRIRSERDIKAVTSAPLLASVQFDAKTRTRPLVVHAEPLSPQAEVFRTLRTNLNFVEVDGDSRLFVMTSSIPGEGKTTTSANLALAIADSGQSVLLVDADLRKPKLAEYMGLEGAVGLTDLLIDRAALADAVQDFRGSGLFVLPAGPVPPNPSELLGSRAMHTLLEELRAEFDWVVLDAPPLLPVTDAAVLAQHGAEVLLVAAADRVNAPQLRRSLEILETVGSSLGGIIMTMARSDGSDAYRYVAYAYGGEHRPAPVVEEVVEPPAPTKRESRGSRRSKRRRANR